QTLRKPEAMVGQFLVPLIVVMFFCVCIGSMPRDIPIGVYNEENCNESDLCFSEDLLSSLNSYALKQIRFNSTADAVEEVRRGRLLGLLHLRPNFSDALLDKIHFDNESSIVQDSIVTFTGDHGNKLL